MGDVDELNSLLGLLLCETLPDNVRRMLVEIQHDLFDLVRFLVGLQLGIKLAVSHLGRGLGRR